MIRTVRSATLSRYREVASSLGLDPMRMLARVGVPPACLEDADSMIAASAACRLLEDSALAAGIEDFGLRMSEERGVSILGPLGLVIREEATIRDALHSMVRYMSLHSEALQMEVEESSGVVVIRTSLALESPRPTRQADEMIVGSLFLILRELIGPDWRPRRVCFAHGAPRSLASYRRRFGPIVEFGADFTGITLAPKDLDAVPPAANAQTARYARQYVELLLAQTDRTMTGQVGRLVRSLLSTGRCSVDRIADQLGVDRRTIHRRLAREGGTYRGLVDDVRADLAMHYLNTTGRPVTEIAELLGFSLHSAFSHWFRRRFGCNASAWRAANASSALTSPAVGQT